MKRTGILLISLIVMLMVDTSVAQEQKKDAPKPCSAGECRQFDFWVGDWDVKANDKIAGTNRISLILDGCVLMEEWKGASGYNGRSFNRFDANTGKWEQTWVDNRGGVLKLSGGYRDGKMVMAGESVQQGEPVQNKITWHKNDDGTVRQVWETSKDGGATWATVFDGLYVKK